MLIAIDYTDISRYSDLFIGQFKLRHREFIDRQNYDVKTLDGLEFDQYDTLASRYLVYSRDGRTVLGCSRLTPISYGCMLADHFPGLVSDPSVFGEADIWEGTRFCIDSRLPKADRLEICSHLACGYVEYALAKGMTKIIGLMPTLILRTVFERNGIELERLGPAQAVGAHARIQAAAIHVNEAQLVRARAKTGLHMHLFPQMAQARSYHVA